MIPTIGLMVAGVAVTMSFYVMTRLTALMEQGGISGGTKVLAGITIVCALLLIAVSVLGMMDLVSAAMSVGTELR